MKFSDLREEEKEAIHQALSNAAEKLGGKNFLLQLIEDVKKEAQSPLHNKEKHFSFSKGFVTWNKALYKETLDLLFTAILREEREGTLLEGLKPKEQKRVENMLKTVSPVLLTVKPKNMKDGEGFSLSIVKRHETGETEISLLFKALFFYNIEFAKKALSYAP